MTNSTDTQSVKNSRQTAHLARLAEGGGKPVRVDTVGADLAKVDALVASGYAPSRAEAFRKAVRSAFAQQNAKTSR